MTKFDEFGLPEPTKYPQMPKVIKMNERIRKLARQSGGEFWQRLENDVVNPEAYITFDPPESLEKFAELIVRECIEQCSKALVEHTGQPSVTHNYAVGLCQDNIKEHFGVEE